MSDMENQQNTHHPYPLEKQKTIDHFGNEVGDGVELAWVDLAYKLTLNKGSIPCLRGKAEEKYLLQPMSATIPPNSLVAVMGSSGAGKTTFLNALSYQMEGGVREGNVYLNNRKLTKSLFKKTCGYVRQNDVLLPNLTVYETLTIYANLLFPMSISQKDKDQRVLSTIKKLGLEQCMHSMIGNDLKRGISGGEKRRVSIAIELLKNPVVLFLDEPTSGLDSKTALSLMNSLAELAHDYNHTIICTIHQPRSQIFTSFDLLILLAKGTPVYFGDASKAIDYFISKGFECPTYENPADFFIDLLTLDSDTPETYNESNERINKLIEMSKEDEMAKPNRKRTMTDTDMAEPRSFGTNVFMQIAVLLYRAVLNGWRDSQYLFGRLVQTLILAVAICLLWWQMSTDQSALQDRISVIFLILLCGGMGEGMIASLIFPMDRLTYIKEKRAGMYKVYSYYIARQLAELPFQIFVPTCFIIVCYMCLGFQYNAVHFANFMLLSLELTFVMNSLGFLAGAAFEMRLGSLLVPIYYIIATFFSGFYVATDNIPVFLRWVKWADPFFYAFMGLVTTEFTGRTFYCKSDEYLILNQNATCSNGEVINIYSETCPITRGIQIVDEYNSNFLETYQFELIVLGFVLGFRLLLLLALYNPPNKV